MGTFSQEQDIFEALKASLYTNNRELRAQELLQRAYQSYPDHTALVTAHKTLTYKELYFRSLLVGQYLAKSGIKAGDTVLLYYENSIEFYCAYFAIWQLGCICAPLNIFLHTRELAHIMVDSDAKAIIVSPTLLTNIEQLLAQHPACRLPLIIDTQAFDWQTPVPTAPLDQALQVPAIPLEGCEEVCLLLYTSGTTGKPKGVMLSSHNIINNTLQGYARFKVGGMQEHERFLCVLPLFHVFAQNACIWLAIITGSAVIIVPKIDRKLMLDGLKQKPTLFFGFPALYGLLCLMKTAPLDTIKMFVSGADMLPDKIRAGFAIIYGRKICSGYGLTEASPVISFNYDNQEQATHVVGKPLVGISIQIRDQDGHTLPTNTVGILWVSGDNIMKGYHGDPESTAQVLQDGWLNTGDLASIDDQGILAIRGRMKDIIIHKGFNIYPAEVENVLMMHPSVTKAAVIGKAEDAHGQVPVAYVAVKAHDPMLEESLRNLCQHNLAAYKIPRTFICMEDLPLNATGKVDKKKLSQVS